MKNVWTLFVLIGLWHHILQPKQRNCKGCKWCTETTIRKSKRICKQINRLKKSDAQVVPVGNIKKQDDPEILGQQLIAAVKRNTSIDAIEYLIDEGVDVDYTDKEKRTALHWASVYALPEVVELLLVHNADVYAQDYRDNTPLHLVIMYRIHPSKRERIIRDLLFAGASIYDRNSMGLNVLEAAVTNELRTFTLLTSFKRSFIRRVGG